MLNFVDSDVSIGETSVRTPPYAGLIDDESAAIMATRTRRILVAAACTALSFGGVPILTAGPASACISGQYADPYTGQCSGGGGGYPSVNGIPCIPGQHRGTCMGFLQNMPEPGATLGPYFGVQ